MTAMYDGVEARVPARCLGCADGIVVLDHQCARNRPMAPGGEYCRCIRPGCGQKLPAGPTVDSTGVTTR